MGQKTLAETIKEITRTHLEKNHGMLLGQSISAVGWVNGTVPDCQGIVELPMTDVAGAGFAVGAAMVGRRPIFVVRFQDFLMLNGSPLINYAAKCKTLHGKTAPVFVRAIASDGLGPVHSGALHSLFMHFPGFRVWAPMTPGEYQQCWDDFMTHDDPLLASEYRLSFARSEELFDLLDPQASLTIYAIASPRFEVACAAELLAAQGILVNIVHLARLKPLALGERELAPLRSSGRGLVVDSGYEICGASQAVACELTAATGLPVNAFGLQDETKCLCPPYQNLAPDAEAIAVRAQAILGRHKVVV
ncbi:MAG: hypothetical protein L3J63_11190 [Geopsychrobacter sp.]|nr:hypothetical protein [Geopsychrobacter sp.]